MNHSLAYEVRNDSQNAFNRYSLVVSDSGRGAVLSRAR